MKRILKLTGYVALGAIPLLAFVGIAPARQARAQSFLSIFGSLTSTVTGIGQLVTGINSTLQSAQNFDQNMVHSLTDLGNIQFNGSQIISSYRNWMGSVQSMSISSAQTSYAQGLENQWLSGEGTQAGSASPQVGSAYSNTYGTLPTSNQAPAGLQQAIDMGDATAKDSISLSILADADANTAIQQAHTLESSAMSTSAGSAPQIEATALAYEIASIAVEHKVLASQLRTTAALLASNGVAIKSAVSGQANAAAAINTFHP